MSRPASNSCVILHVSVAAQLGQGTSVAEGRLSGSPSHWYGSASRFYEASPEAVAAFDWSSLTGAPEDQEFGNLLGHGVEEELHFVPGVSMVMPVIRSVVSGYTKS